MAIQIPGFKYGNLLAAVAHTSNQFKAVVINTSGKIALAGAGVAIDGILQNNPAQDYPCAVMKDGVSKAVAGATVALGDQLTPDANGKLIPAVATDHIVGVAMESGALDNIITVLINYKGLQT